MRWLKKHQGETLQVAAIPMQVVGPVKIISKEVTDDILIPLATLETPLWPSTHRGARVCTEAGGVSATIVDERMSRSVLVEADSAAEIYRIYLEIQQKKLNYKPSSVPLASLPNCLILMVKL